MPPKAIRRDRNSDREGPSSPPPPRDTQILNSTWFADQRYSLIRNSVSLTNGFEDGRKTFNSIFDNHNQQRGSGPYSVFRRQSIPHVERDVSLRAAQALAGLMMETKQSKFFVEVQCAVVRSKSNESIRYILSSNGGRAKLNDGLKEVLHCLSPPARTSAASSSAHSASGRQSGRLQEVIDAIKNGRVGYIGPRVASKILKGTAEEYEEYEEYEECEEYQEGEAGESEETVSVHAETLFLGSEEILLSADEEIVKVLGNRRPCADCAHAYVIAGKSHLIASSSKEQSADDEARKNAKKARSFVQMSFTLGSSTINYGRMYRSMGSRTGLGSAMQRLRVNQKEAMHRLGKATELGELNPLRFYGNATEATATPLASPSNSDDDHDD